MSQGYVEDFTDHDTTLFYLYPGASPTCIGMFDSGAVWRVLVASAPDVLTLFVAFDRFVHKGPLHAHSGYCSLAFLHAIRGKV